MSTHSPAPLVAPAPMLANAADRIPVSVDPSSPEWLYEPKWDGFRCIVVRDGDQVVLSSRNERPFNRYFPELLPVFAARLPDRCMLDGEIVLPRADGRGLDFDALLQRIHPAESRVRRLAVETPASFVAFDLLAEGADDLMDAPLVDRRARLERLAVAWTAPLHLCPASTDPVVAERWFHEFEGAGLDGVIAKRLTDRYVPDKRVLVKVKHRRTADCVVAGFRIHKDGNGVGSLLLGLYDEQGRLHHVGVASSFSAKRRAELLAELEPFTDGAAAEHPWREWADMATVDQGPGGQRMPGGVSRWTAGKDMGWVPMRIERVAEVTFGQLESGRFRHGSSLLRWRDDRLPASCRYDQLEVASPVAFDLLVGQSPGGS